VKVAVISAHTCPLAALGGKETGGMNVYVRETCRELARRGVRVDVFTRSQDPHLPRVRTLAPGARVIHVPAGPQRPYNKYRLVEHLPAFVERVQQLGEGKYDLIHSHYWLSGMAALELRRRWNVPVVHMFHTLGFLKNRAARKREELEGSVRIRWEWEIATRADALIASQPLERAQLIWHYDAPPQRIHVIPCGVDTSLFRPRNRREALQALGLDPRPWLLFVGRLEPIKGLDTLLRAMGVLTQRFNGAQPGPALLIIGGDRDASDPSKSEGRLREQTKRLGLQDRVFFMGSRPQEELPLFYAASEACILPSRYESFGMVALEAMACGTPVIASHVGGLGFTVMDGVTGFLVPEGDAEGLAGRIHRLLESPSLRDEFARRAKERAKDFTWDRVVSSILELYERLLFRPTEADLREGSLRSEEMGYGTKGIR